MLAYNLVVNGVHLNLNEGFVSVVVRAVGIISIGVLLLSTLLGCVAPGSSVGHLSIRGTLASDTGEPLANRELQFLLPAAYGLGGFDLALNNPEDFGHQDHVFRVTTGPGGEFSYDLGNHVYHVGYWLIPPLGPIPRHPPAPFVLVRAAGIGGEYYAVETQSGRFKVFTVNHEELPLEEAYLSKLIAGYESGIGANGRWTVGIIDLQVAASKSTVQQGRGADVE